MKLYSLIKNLSCRTVGNLNIDIDGLYHKDTEVKNNGLFFCIKGTRVDGNTFVQSAIKNGAVAIVTDQEIHNLPFISQVIVKDTREAMSLIACKFFGSPADKLKIIAVTGTNGKTTITNIISNFLNNQNIKSAIIGTNGIYFGNYHFDTFMTTPDPIELQYYLSLMVKNHITHVCMEVSAHAIDLHKIDGIVFELSIFTNLTEDHLDYFKTMEKYFETKSKLFTKKYTKFGIICVDDDYGKLLSQSINIPYLTYSIYNNSNAKASKIKFRNQKQCFSVNNKFDYEMNLFGRFNILNSLASILALNKLGFDDKIICDCLKDIKPVPGRFNTMFVDGKVVVIDYAHTPDGLKNILSSCKEICEGKVISVFGCGGNREVQKRSIMGKISTEIADYTIITSDNPRFEKRMDIIEDIKRGATKNFEIEQDREKAIKLAINKAEPGDFVVISGKGAENYIDENGVKIHYNDAEVVEKLR